MNDLEKAKRSARYFQILLMGCDVDDHAMCRRDATEAQKWERSDAMVVLSVDRLTGQIKMISLMRDTWVDIPGHGMGKLNAPVVYGGPELAMQVINKSFDLNIRKYAMINTIDMVDLVDAFGGVDIDLTIEEAIYINVWMPNVKIVTGRYDDDVPRITMDGMNRLNGMQTLAHARNRTVGYIRGRENRINTVLLAMAKRAKNEMSRRDLLRYALDVRKYVKTNFNALDILRLLRLGMKADLDAVETYHAPGEGSYEVKRDGTWRMETDFEKASEMLWDFLRGNIE